jgi:hypothetical protein
MTAEELSRLLGVSSGEGVVDGRVDLTALFVPRARASVKLWLTLRLEAAQLGAQHLCEQRVVAIRRASAIQTREQDIRVGQCLKGLGRPTLVEHGVAQRSRQRAKNRGAEQKGHPIWLELRKHLVAEIFRHDPVVAGEARQSSVRVRLVAQ